MAIQKKQKIGLLIILFLATVLVWIFVFIENHQSNLLAMKFLDVGQGDAEFIETPDKKQVLIDGGPDLTILEKLGRAMSFYDHYIDLIILTHPEADHLNGLIEVAKRYRIGAIITTGVVRDTEEYKQWIEIIKEKDIPIYIDRKSVV